ncbi:MAG: hypothetical protein QXX12_03780 [Nanopusillaceae archaeon]
MIDITHTKRPEFIQLVLIMAVVCLALGAITPAVSAVEYDDLTYSSGDSVYGSGSILFTDGITPFISLPLPDGTDIFIRTMAHSDSSIRRYGPVTISEMSSIADYTTLPYVSIASFDTAVFESPPSYDSDTYDRLSKMLDFVMSYTNIDSNELCSYTLTNGGSCQLRVNNLSHMSEITYDYLYSDSLDLSLTAFAPDDPSGMYVLNLDGALIEDTTYTVGVNRYTDEFKYLIDSYAYTDGSGGYTFTGSRSLTLPIYYQSFTNMPYSYEVSINVNDENGYLDTRYPVYWSDLGGLYDSAPAPVLPTPIPTPTQTFIPTLPVNPSDIIPDPESLNDTVNITGWYQDSGFEGNNITASIYSGIRGWFNENLAPVIDFFLTPTNYVATVISDSAETSTDGISYITEELGSYAAPFNTVGAYVVRLVPEVVWLVVFAALSIGYVVLLIRISTGSIKDTIGRFLGGSK